MTDKKTIPKSSDRIPITALSSFRLEANRSSKGLSILLSGIVGVSDFSDKSILLLSHGGRINVVGESLFIDLFENNTVDIVGKVMEIIFIYGKN